MTLGDQFLRRSRIPHAGTDFVGNKFAVRRVRRAVDVHVPEGSEPFCEAPTVVAVFPEGESFVFGDGEGRAGIGLVHETGRGGSAEGEDFWVGGADVVHFLWGYQVVVQGRGPIGGSLKDGEGFEVCFRGEFGDGLDCCGSRADDAYSFVGEVPFGGPAGCVEGFALEDFYAGDVGEGGFVEDAHGCDEESGGVLTAVDICEEPCPSDFLVVGGFDLGVELHIFSEVELVCDVLAVSQSLGLRGEVFGPCPFV